MHNGATFSHKISALDLILCSKIAKFGAIFLKKLPKKKNSEKKSVFEKMFFCLKMSKKRQKNDF